MKTYKKNTDRKESQQQSCTAMFKTDKTDLRGKILETLYGYVQSNTKYKIQLQN